MALTTGCQLQLSLLTVSFNSHSCIFLIAQECCLCLRVTVAMIYNLTLPPVDMLHPPGGAPGEHQPVGHGACVIYGL